MEVLIGGLKEKEEKLRKKQNFLTQKYYDLYLAYQYGFDVGVDIKKAVYYGIKYISRINIKDADYRTCLKIQCEIADINNMIAIITYDDMINMFPICKWFEGKKFEGKDYFSTKEFLETVRTDESIGSGVDEFFLNYYNTDIINFSVKSWLVYDRLMRFENKPGLLEGFLDIVDPEHKIQTFTYHEKEGYIYNKNTGRTQKVQKPKRRIPKYIKIVK